MVSDLVLFTESSRNPHRIKPKTLTTRGNPCIPFLLRHKSSAGPADSTASRLFQNVPASPDWQGTALQRTPGPTLRVPVYRSLTSDRIRHSPSTLRGTSPGSPASRGLSDAQEYSMLPPREYIQRADHSSLRPLVQTSHADQSRACH